jgi:hypothetical protein
LLNFKKALGVHSKKKETLTEYKILHFERRQMYTQ